jgi:arsenate reductase
MSGQAPWRARPFLCGAAMVLLSGLLDAQSPAKDATVLFVCEHGTAKSVIAKEWFDRLARERNLAFRSLSRGVTPDDAVPPAVERNLKNDGFDLAGFAPRRLEKADLATAIYVVAIGVDSPLLREASTVPVESWSDIPPASTQYAASRDAMRTRIEALLTKLASEERRKAR